MPGCCHCKHIESPAQPAAAPSSPSVRSNPMASNVETLIRGAVVKGIGKLADFNRKRLPRPTDAHPFLTGIHKPLTEAFTLEELRVDGEIPSQLTGRYLRNGPNPAAAPEDRQSTRLHSSP